MLEILKRLFKIQKGAFIDVGVNLGQTLLKVKTADRERRYIGFEPNPVCTSYVDRLVETNSFTSCTIIPTGLFTETKTLQLYLYQENSDDSSASMVKELRPEGEIKQTIYVPVSEFDPVADLLEIDTIGVIKVDVEGAELEVFQTLQNAIETHRPVILVEILPVSQGRESKQLVRQQRLGSLLKELGYTVYRIQKRGKSSFAGLEKVTLTEVDQSNQLRDYLLAPEEKAAIVETSLSGKTIH